MLQNIHGQVITAPVNISTTGDNTIIGAPTIGELFIHELVVNPSAAMTITIKCGSRTVGVFTLSGGQPITLSDIVSMDGEPRFKCYQGEAFIINLSAAGSLTGTIAYSYKT